MALDLVTFAPKDSKELLAGLLSEIAGVAIKQAEDFMDEINKHLERLAQKVWTTTNNLIQKKITPESADVAYRTQLNTLRAVVLASQYMVFDTAQKVMDTIKKVVFAVAKNLAKVVLL